LFGRGCFAAHRDIFALQFLERAKRQRDAELTALREENGRLRRAAAASVGDEEAKRLRERLKELETVNAHLTEKKDTFDRLTFAYSKWCYDLKGKDERIAALEADLAHMTKRRDELAGRVDVQDKELAALKGRRFGAF
jgi:chromosome segregation ATPase